MIDGGRAVGLTFLALVLGAVPAWVSSANGASPTAVARPAAPGTCIEDPATMRRNHPALLADWRRRAVRDGERRVRLPDGRDVALSLKQTCLGCHGQAAAFCERCHAEVGATVACWGCHSPSDARQE